MKNIYLDIDGVLLKKDGTLAEGFDEFLKFFVNNHDVYWLTTHCRGGENRAIEHILEKNNLSEKTLNLLDKIRPTDWQTLKTEAIDFSKDFVWFEDYLMGSEKKVLLEENAFFRLYVINLKNKPNQLIDMTSISYNESLWCWQKMSLNISFSKEELQMIQKGFISNEGMNERWQFAFQDDTLYIMRHWTRWVNYKLKFEFLDGEYFVTDCYISNLVSQNKKDKATFFENNHHGIFIIWLIENYLLKKNRGFLLDLQFVYSCLKIPIDSIHGYNHWKNVEKIGHQIAEKNGADKEFISAFAFLHDIGRLNEGSDPNHGRESAKMIEENFKLKKPEQQKQLLEAVAQHNNPNAKNDDITIQTCWDADRLDLPRVGKIVDETFLNTKEGKELARKKPK